MEIGGSLGSVAINTALRAMLPQLLEKYDVIHICGKGNLDASLADTPGYRQYEFLSDGLRNLYALADVVISRAGANVICELLALKKPNILIPLPLDQSRGDQILHGIGLGRLGSSRSIGLRSLGSGGSLGLAAAGGQRQNHHHCQKQCQILFHTSFPPFLKIPMPIQVSD